MLKTIVGFFWPVLPAEISQDSKSALRADIKAAGVWGKPLGDTNRDAVNVWARHSDRESRASNREWLKLHANTFSKRWAVLSCVQWAGAAAASGHLIAEVPLTLAAFATGVVAIGFVFARRALAH